MCYVSYRRDIPPRISPVVTTAAIVQQTVRELPAEEAWCQPTQYCPISLLWGALVCSYVTWRKQCLLSHVHLFLIITLLGRWGTEWCVFWGRVWIDSGHATGWDCLCLHWSADQWRTDAEIDKLVIFVEFLLVWWFAMVCGVIVFVCANALFLFLVSSLVFRALFLLLPHPNPVECSVVYDLKTFHQPKVYFTLGEGGQKEHSVTLSAILTKSVGV